MEKATGQVKRATGGGQATPVLDLAVNSASERGLLGIALHPDFPALPFVYIRWTESSTGHHGTAQPPFRVQGDRNDDVRRRPAAAALSAHPPRGHRQRRAWSCCPAPPTRIRSSAGAMTSGRRGRPLYGATHWAPNTTAVCGSVRPGPTRRPPPPAAACTGCA
ncbi:PQQ-dependent sugar dehydrogenase [Massilia litorea]|uniref:PQQ-dependent sugar dehydrogenase n=1 Tax=Massilia litorea TaxID=2769491 RepID=UPI001D0D6D42